MIWIASPDTNCYFTVASNLYKSFHALLNRFMEVDMQMGPVRATMGNVCKSCAGETIATAHRNWCLRSAASVTFAIEGV